MYGTFAGRSGEWQLMTRADVEEKMRRGDRALACGQHKTAKYYGSIAKWIPEGLRQAFITYCALPGKQSERFFEPVEGTSCHFHMHSCLKAFGRAYTPRHEFPRVNLVRKMFHSVLCNISREGEAMHEIGRADGHSASMGLKTYALQGPTCPGATSRAFRSVSCRLPW